MTKRERRLIENFKRDMKKNGRVWSTLQEQPNYSWYTVSNPTVSDGKQADLLTARA